LLTRRVVAVAGGSLSDDATLLVLDWHGGHGRERRTSGGSEPHIASGPVRSRHD
jgi:hypothetical protein